MLITGANQNDKSKKESLAERCAFLLYEQSPEARYDIYKEIKGYRKEKGLYDIRSGIVHNGKSDVDPKDVIRLKNIAIGCLFKVLELSRINTESMSSIESIIKWVDQKKMLAYYGVNY